MNKKTNSKNKKIIKIPDKPVKVVRLRIVMAFIITLFLILIVRLFFLQFVEGYSLKEKANRQQTINKIISPKRGTIYDSTGKALAISASVDTVSINPTKIEEKNKEKVAKILSDTFELNYEETLEKVNSNSSVQTIIKKVEKDKIDILKKAMEENKITVGINIDEDTKRYYPYNSLASHIIGFTGTDNQGLYGIELYWNELLTGTSGKIVTTGDVHNDEISKSNKQYTEVENGSDLYLTIDVNIQSIVEEHIEEAVLNNEAQAAGAIIMNPKNGDILAMATYPNYNLNTPFEPNNDSLKEIWDELSSEDKSAELSKMWKDKNFSSTYEPGSTFKVLMSAIALEEDITETDIAGDFHCIGYQDIYGTKIGCWNTTGSHGYESLRDALANSCNPAFMQLGARIGKEKLYKYFEAFGLFEKTGIAISGESSSRFHNIDDMGPVELATTSFGQRFEITPLQLITAVGSIANDGKLVTPRIVKQVNNPNTQTIEEIPINNVRQVVSKETAEQVRSMMEDVVSTGTGKYGAVEGFSIGGKTGTSEPVAGKEEVGYIVSFVAISPVENPEIVALIQVYNPGGSNPEGSKIAAPTMAEILSEVLPYIGMTSDNVTTDILNLDNNVTPSYIQVPNITNKTVTEAEKILEEYGLKSLVSIEGDKNSILVTEQYPAANTDILSNSTILLYTEENDIRTSQTVPDLFGMTLAAARSTLNSKNLNISYEGSGKVVEQSIEKNETVEEGTIIHVILE